MNVLNQLVCSGVLRAQTYPIMLMKTVYHSGSSQKKHSKHTLRSTELNNLEQFRRLA